MVAHLVSIYVLMFLIHIASLVMVLFQRDETHQREYLRVI